MSGTSARSYEFLSNLTDTDLGDPGAVVGAALIMESELLALPVDPGEEVCRMVGSSAIEATNRIYEQYENNLEYAFAQNVLDHDTTAIEAYPMYDRFDRLVRNEVELAGINTTSRVVFIGSGPFPISPILIHRLSGGARVVCLDMSEEACEVSTRVVERLGFKNKIEIRHLSAENAELPTVSTPGDVGANSVAIIALLAQPKADIVDRIVLSMTPDQKIVMRTAEGNRHLFYQGVDEGKVIDRSFNATPGFNVIQRYHAGRGDTISGVVLQQLYTPWVHRI